jgi:hypothetical protein
MATFGDLLCVRRRLEGDAGFFTEPVRRRAFLAFRICFAIVIRRAVISSDTANCYSETGHAVKCAAQDLRSYFQQVGLIEKRVELGACRPGPLDISLPRELSSESLLVDDAKLQF